MGTRAYVIDAEDRSIERTEFITSAEWGGMVDCDKPNLVYEFPWGDQIWATDTREEWLKGRASSLKTIDCFRVMGWDDKPAEHEGSEPIAHMGVVVGMEIGPDEYLPPTVTLDLLYDWIEFLD